MKNALVLFVAGIAFSTPAFAGPAETAMLHFAQSAEGGDGVRRVAAETSTGDIGAAYDHFSESRSGGDGARRLVISAQDSGLVAVARQILHNDEHGDN